MKGELKPASYKEKTSYKLPEGAEVIKRNLRISVEEIENGYIISKDYDIEYLLEGDNRYDYYCKKMYSKTNPLKDIEFEDEEESLADKFED